MFIRWAISKEKKFRMINREFTKNKNNIKKNCKKIILNKKSLIKSCAPSLQDNFYKI